MTQNTMSYWNITAEKPNYPSLKKNIETDTLIIGGGITGVTCAYCLAEQKADVVLIEAGELCDGTTGNTTGKTTIQHDVIYSTIIKKHGRNSAQLYADSQAEALDFIRKCVLKESIDCQLADNTAYIYASSEAEVESVKKEYEAAIELHIDAEFIEKPSFPSNSFCMTGFKNQAVFHSIRYVSTLAKSAVSKGAKIYCNTKAMKVENGDIITVHCDNGITIKAKHLVMATQFPLFEGMGLYFTRLYAERDYGIAVETKRDWPDGSYINNGEPARSD